MALSVVLSVVSSSVVVVVILVVVMMGVHQWVEMRSIYTGNRGGLEEDIG